MQDNTESHNLIRDNHPIENIVALLGSLPTRWGRMTPLSRLLIIETARVLQKRNILTPGQRLSDQNKNVGMIGGTRRGSLHTDQAFVETMKEGPGLASPALFGYTLANIPLAEAAVAHGLTGPVYAIFDTRTPLESAEKEAQRLLDLQNNLDLMLACEFDHYEQDGRHELSVILTVIEH
ncbi:beta-ketoacyl synthase N-terminal-like domain-containing protein [Desulfosediminicola flagellatus]|uniref:beta-ketoacyl synthase N-terminal-like domain-containing protein n=1 Tax=Desulfosediminicola flagellatus TaxID=2569541 RepID=UPI0010AC9B3C|nr:beta-ketoacyl synthase N-terminal-like domain-containing protein [Desulfosediminicola flagellatus]